MALADFSESISLEVVNGIGGGEHIVMSDIEIKKFRAIKSCQFSKIPPYLKSASNSTLF